MYLSNVEHFILWIVSFSCSVLYSEVQCVGYIDSKRRFIWEDARKRCPNFGKSFKDIPDGQKVFTIASSVKEWTNSTSTVFWIGGYEVFTPWVSIKGCAEDGQHKDASRSPFQNPDNQAKLCSIRCNQMHFVLKGSTCECRGSAKSFLTVNSNRCTTACPGNAAESCGGLQVYNVFMKYRYSTEDRHLCLSTSFKDDQWQPKPRHCSDKLKYVYKEHLNIYQSRDHYDWFKARSIAEERGTFLYDKHELYQPNANFSTDEDYWIGIFRNTTILWNKESDLRKTGKCVSITRTKVSWLRELRNCNEKFLYKCEKDDGIKLQSSPIPSPIGKGEHSNDGLNTESILIRATINNISVPTSSTENLTTIESETNGPEKIMIADYQLYIYIAVALGTAVFVCAVFICIILIRRCLSMKPKENLRSATVTTDISEEYNENNYGSTNPGLKTDEHIYDEIEVPTMYDIRINNYSEPLPLKDPIDNHLKREYAEPYDSLKHGRFKEYCSPRGKDKSLMIKPQQHKDKGTTKICHRKNSGSYNGQFENLQCALKVHAHYSSVKKHNDKQINDMNSLQQKDISNKYFILEQQSSEYA